MCAMYWRRHGVERPPQVPRGAATLRLCRRCGQPTAQPRRGWCNRCYQYWWRYHVERPLRPRPLRPCQTCGQLVQEFHRGRCNPCYQYWYRTGRERPPELWQRREG